MKAYSVYVGLILTCTVSCAASGAIYFVAPDAAADNAGTRQAPISLKRANKLLKPGDTAILLDGTYTHTPISPARSGANGKSITYRAANRHKAIFTEGRSAPKFRGAASIVVSHRSHITIEGIKSVGVKRWLIGVEASRITLSDCRFEKSTG
ncbi:MAG: hypothetical protein QGG25_09815 [Phycisphaerae bacterium]|nr:hypothetical protein [Phycisphaerae bacterium]